MKWVNTPLCEAAALWFCAGSNREKIGVIGSPAEAKESLRSQFGRQGGA